MTNNNCASALLLKIGRYRKCKIKLQNYGNTPYGNIFTLVLCSFTSGLRFCISSAVVKMLARHNRWIDLVSGRLQRSVLWSDLHLDAFQRVVLGLFECKPENAVAERAVAVGSTRRSVCVDGRRGVSAGIAGGRPADGLVGVPASRLVDSVEVARRTAVEPPASAVLLGTVRHVEVIVHVGCTKRHVVMVTQRITCITPRYTYVLRLISNNTTFTTNVVTYSNSPRQLKVPKGDVWTRTQRILRCLCLNVLSFFFFCYLRHW